MLPLNDYTNKVREKVGMRGDFFFVKSCLTITKKVNLQLNH